MTLCEVGRLRRPRNAREDNIKNDLHDAEWEIGLNWFRKGTEGWFF
jgi:hypothetical protein